MQHPFENVSKTEPAEGDYLLARAKRQLENLLRAEGASRSQALAEVHKQFNNPERKANHEHH